MENLNIKHLTYALEDIQKVISDLAKGLAEEVEEDYCTTEDKKKEPFDEHIIDQYISLLKSARDLMTRIKEARWDNANDVIRIFNDEE